MTDAEYFYKYRDKTQYISSDFAGFLHFHIYFLHNNIFLEINKRKSKIIKKCSVENFIKSAKNDVFNHSEKIEKIEHLKSEYIKNKIKDF